MIGKYLLKLPKVERLPVILSPYNYFNVISNKVRIFLIIVITY